MARSDVQKWGTAAWVKDLEVEELDCGHWTLDTTSDAGEGPGEPISGVVCFGVREVLELE
jgi:hypothetical protein